MARLRWLLPLAIVLVWLGSAAPLSILGAGLWQRVIRIAVVAVQGHGEPGRYVEDLPRRSGGGDGRTGIERRGPSRRLCILRC